MSVIPFAKAYRAAGHVVLPIPTGTKKATVPGWSDPLRTDFIFGDEGNLAWRLDSTGDVDLDCIEAILMASYFLPPTGAKSGRPATGKPSHWFYEDPEGTLAYIKYEDPAGGTILEIRTGPGHYTLVPPSLMPEARGLPAEYAVWYADGPPSQPGSILIQRGAALLATAVLLGRRLGRYGYGHDARLEVAGTLLRLGVTVEEAITVGEAISGPTENTEVSDVRVVTVSTAAKLAKAGTRVAGGPSLAERIGERGKETIRAITGWFGGHNPDILFTVISGGGFPHTEVGDAEFFAARNANSVRYDHRRGRWLLWGEHHWGPQTNGEMGRLAREAIRARQAAALEINDNEIRRMAIKWALAGETRARLTNMLDRARDYQPLADTGDAWDADPWLLGVKNGVVDLRTGTLRPGQPEDCITMQAAVAFDPAAECPEWDKAVDEIFLGDKELIAYMDRFFGYSLTGDCREEALPLCFGGGANGKGTLMNTVGKALGDYADDLPFSAFELNARAGISNDLAKIVGKRYVTSSESGETARLNESRVKTLTGRDPITARFLYQEFFTFRPQAKFWLATNKKPIIKDDSVGFWRRLHLVPFEADFQKNPDKTLKDRLEANELPGILARMVRGCLEWQRIGLVPPESVLTATKEYRNESDPLDEFLSDECILVETARTQSDPLYVAYTRWADRKGERERLTRRAFGTRMKLRFRSEENRHVWYLGVGLRHTDSF